MKNYSYRVSLQGNGQLRGRPMWIGEDFKSSKRGVTTRLHSITI